jgi:UDP-N-acetylmuramoyl-tripeptide--D-alanyl-D-alanine ligase
MLELGDKASHYHDKIGGLIAHLGIDSFISVGNLMRNSFLAAKRCGMKNTWFCSTKEEAAALLKKIAQPDDVVLVKGSRATGMEDVIKCFITSFTR